MAVVIDQLGLLGIPKQPLTVARVVGIACSRPASISWCASSRTDDRWRAGGPAATMALMSADPTVTTERRRGADRRGEERRSSGGRRAADTEGRFALAPAFWAIIGAAVVAYLFFMALGNVKPGDAPVATGIALGLAVLWLAHAWRRVLVGSRSPSPDRERRGF